MSTFAAELKAIRAQLGFRSARGFFEELNAKGIGFNYSYYMRLEQGGLPSEKVVRAMAAILGPERGDRLVLAYCRSQFPKHGHLFPEPASSRPADSVGNPATPPAPTQRELSLKQVAAIAAAEANYHLFLLATLARRPLGSEELKALFSSKALVGARRALIAAAVLRETAHGLEAAAVEARFPEAFSADLKATYARFDEWDISFGEKFPFEELYSKMFLKRVSGRYLLIIRKQLELLADLVRSADETDVRYNDQVLQFKVLIKQGRLPG